MTQSQHSVDQGIGGSKVENFVLGFAVENFVHKIRLSCTSSLGSLSIRETNCKICLTRDVKRGAAEAVGGGVEVASRPKPHNI